MGVNLSGGHRGDSFCHIPWWNCGKFTIEMIVIPCACSAKLSFYRWLFKETHLFYQIMKNLVQNVVVEITLCITDMQITFTKQFPYEIWPYIDHWLKQNLSSCVQEHNAASRLYVWSNHAISLLPSFIRPWFSLFFLLSFTMKHIINMKRW